jgi:hypothetical protein
MTTPVCEFVVFTKRFIEVGGNRAIITSEDEPVFMIEEH